MDIPLILFAVFCSSMFSVLAIITKINPAYRHSIGSRMDIIKALGFDKGDNKLDIPFFTRVVKPGILKWVEWLGRLTPQKMRDEIQQKLKMAGNPFGLDAAGWIFIRMLLCTIMPTCLFSLMAFRNSPKLTSLIMSVILGVFSFLIPDIILKQKIKQQQKLVLKVLPDVLDILTVSVEAGLSFDGALAKVAEKIPGPLSRGFTKVLNEVKIGRPRKDALKDMAEHWDISELIGFVTAVIQADQLGISMANVLRIQSQQIRQKRKQQVEEAAMKAPVKMLLPLVLFIFPTIFIILLGPAIIMAMELF